MTAKSRLDVIRDQVAILSLAEGFLATSILLALLRLEVFGAIGTRRETVAMHNHPSLRGRELARFLDTSSAESLLDLGCEPGTYAFHLGKADPLLALIDSAGVLEVAREIASRYPMENPVEYVPLDVTTEDIPGTYEIVLDSNTLHMLGEEASRKLIRRLYDNVAPGGSLVIQAQFSKDDRMGGRWPVFFDLVQLCITREGRNHTPSETAEWMEDGGFRDIELVPRSLVNTNSFIRGYRR